MQRPLLKSLRWLLKKLSQLTIARYRPGVIAITGSVGKTSTKRAIAAVLSSERHVRVSYGNFNNEIGVPLTILGEWQEIKGVFFWPRVLFTSIAQLIRRTPYPEILLLEYGVDRPGDMRYLLEVAQPNIGLLTAIGEIPAHVEFFSGPEEVAEEKARLIERLPPGGVAVLNYDDATVMDLQDRTRAHAITFGFGEGADVRITNFEERSERVSAKNGARPLGIAFKLEYAGSVVPVVLGGAFGHAQAYAAGAAAAVGVMFGMNLVRIAEALGRYEPPPGRMRLLDGVKGTYILDDSYNASPLSMHAALDTLRALPAKRKVAVLGDMLEIGKYAIEAHEAIGRLAAHAADALITVGPRAKFIAEAAKKEGMSRRAIMSFDTAEEAQRPVQDLIRKGDLILIKASRAIGLEKVVEEIKQE
jgi:UDP-N-acetylmuramoyl-tripeptide--D-alanyl-D-alanine ligase